MDASRYPPIKTEADISKLHSESQQLRNRQFVLSTVGISSAGLSSWLISSSDTFESQAMATTFILVLLLILFTWSFFLRCRIGQISRYLDVRNASEWEPLFRAFSQRKGTRYISQSIAVMILYLLLGILVLTRFLALSSPPIGSPFTIAVVFCAVVLTATTMYLTVTRKAYDIRASENWKEVLDEHFSSCCSDETEATATPVT